MDLHVLFNEIKTILVIDWPSRDVPDTLVRAGFQVVARGGPGPTDYSAYELSDGEIVSRRTGRPPEHADLVYSYRPLSELPGIVAMASGLGAKTIWSQSGLAAAGVKDSKGCWVAEAPLRNAHTLAQSVGLHLITEPYIADAVRNIQGSH